MGYGEAKEAQMLIDAHTHLRIGNSPDDAVGLVGAMRRAGIDKAFVLADEPLHNCTAEQVMREIRPFAGTLYAIANLSPFYPRPDILLFESWLRENKIYGAKFYPGYEHFYPWDDRFVATCLPYLKLLAKYNRPVMFHSGDLYKSGSTRSAKLKYSHPLHIDDLATDMPDLKIVICHMGYPWVIDAAEVCYKNENVSVDLSGFVYGKTTPEDGFKFQHFLGEFRRVMSDPARLLFGTDWPVAEHESYLYTIKALIPEAEHELVFHQNAERVFGI